MGRDGQASRKEKHVEDVFCLRFHLGASNLLAQLIGAINLQLQLTACTGLKMVIKVLPAPSPELVAELVLACPALSPPRPSLPGRRLVQLVPDSTFPRVDPKPLEKGWSLLGRLENLHPPRHCPPCRAVN